MTPLIEYPDPAQIFTVTPDEYGVKTASLLTDIDTNFTTSVRNNQQQNVELITADALAYLDVDNEEILAKGYKLEGFYFAIVRFGLVQWYTISKVSVNERKLLDNDIDNIQVELIKSIAPEVES